MLLQLELPSGPPPFCSPPHRLQPPTPSPPLSMSPLQPHRAHDTRHERHPNHSPCLRLHSCSLHRPKLKTHTLEPSSPCRAHPDPSDDAPTTTAASPTVAIATPATSTTATTSHFLNRCGSIDPCAAALFQYCQEECHRRYGHQRGEDVGGNAYSGRPASWVEGPHCFSSDCCSLIICTVGNFVLSSRSATGRLP